MKAKSKKIVPLDQAIAEAKTLLDANGKSKVPLKELAQRWHCSMPRVNIILREARGGKKLRRRTAKAAAAAPVRRVRAVGGHPKLRQLVARAQAVEAKLSATAQQLAAIPGIRPAEVRSIARRSTQAVWGEFAEYLQTFAAGLATGRRRRRRGRRAAKK